MPNKKVAIMVLEDEWHLLDTIKRKLESSNMEPQGFPSAEEALNYLLDETNQLPDMIWLDYHLKDMDGLEFTRKLKDIPRLAKIPIIVVSNSASDETVQNILALGADKYILKSEHRLGDIVSVIEEILKTAK